MKFRYIKTLLIGCICNMALMTTVNAYTDDEILGLLSLEEMPIYLTIDNQYIGEEDSVIINSDGIYMPLREMAERFGFHSILWDGETKTVNMTDGKTNIILSIDQNRILRDGMVIETMNPPVLINGTTMLELNVIEEVFECSAEYVESFSTLSIIKDAEEMVTNGGNDYDLEELLWLSRIVTVEARNLPMEGKIAIANVVLNRKKSSIFPDTVYDVIFEIDYHVQFPPAHKSGFSESVPSKESIKASIMALNGYNNIDECLFFNNSPFSSKSDDLYKIIEGEYFYY